MRKIRDLYDDRVKLMSPAERLQLAKLILDDLALAESDVDVDDKWSDDDLAEISAFSARQGDDASPRAGGQS